jgi:hypothetical protein
MHTNKHTHTHTHTQVKVPGEPSLYQVAAADVFSFPTKRFHLAEVVNVPQPSGKCVRAAKAAGLPPMIIFNIQLPIYSVSQSHMFLDTQFMHSSLDTLENGLKFWIMGPL